MLEKIVHNQPANIVNVCSIYSATLVLIQQGSAGHYPPSFPPAGEAHNPKGGSPARLGGNAFCDAPPSLGGRVIAVVTTVVRANATAAQPDGTVADQVLRQPAR
jgi:hypothetical protein